jgi:hypothetical protein
MEQNRNFKGLKKYESLLKMVCMTEEYFYLKKDEWEGCLGVACVISVIEGISPSIFALSKHLDMPHHDIHLQKAFERLKISGVFSNRQDVKGDPLLNGNGTDILWRTAAERERTAWCHIAGLASGKIGLGKVGIKKELKSESEITIT